jgi:phosphatidate phosphatase LPIN
MNLLRGVSNLWRGENKATLSGAIDIIAVEDEDGAIRCTPFHVRFGRLSGVLNPKEKVVSIKVNGEKVGLKMKLGPAGEAFFLEESSNSVPGDAFLVTSPISSPLSSPMYKPLGASADGGGMEPLSLDSEQAPPAGELERGGSPPILVDAPVGRSDGQPEGKGAPGQGPDRPIAGLRVQTTMEEWEEQYRLLSPQHAPCSPGGASENAGTALVRGDGDVNTPGNKQKASRRESANPPAAMPVSDASKKAALSSAGAERNDEKSSWSWKWQWGEPAPVREKSFDKKKGAKFVDSKEGLAAEYGGAAPAAVVAEGGDGAAGEKVTPPPRTAAKPAAPATELAVDVGAAAPPASPGAATWDRVEMSLCAHLVTAQRPELLRDDGGYNTDPDVLKCFLEHKIRDSKNVSAEVLRDERLLFLFNEGVLYKWDRAAVLVMSQIASFSDGPGASGPAKDGAAHPAPASRSSFFGGWFGGGKDRPSPGQKKATPFLPTEGTDDGTSAAVVTEGPDEAGAEGTKPKRSANLDFGRKPSPDAAEASRSRAESPAHSLSPRQRQSDYAVRSQDMLATRKGSTTFYRKRLRPPVQEVAAWNLLEGCNKIEFSVNTSRQQTVVVEARLFLWPTNSKIVVSDVDGTITKSDLMGHIAPVFGATWSHTGVVSLYSTIVDHGYKIMYLSSRNIGQSDRTKSYLKGLNEGDHRLPVGPVVLSPDRLFQSLAREVIYHRPQDFKVPALRDIRQLFPSNQPSPFYAGFGNRDSDVLAYKAVDIPDGKIFIINPRGEIVAHNHEREFNYVSLKSLKDEVFPFIKRRETSGSLTIHDSFTDTNFWKIPIRDLGSDDEGGNGEAASDRRRVSVADVEDDVDDDDSVNSDFADEGSFKGGKETA